MLHYLRIVAVCVCVCEFTRDVDNFVKDFG